MKPPKVSASMILIIAEEKEQRKRHAEEMLQIKYSLLTSLLVDIADVFEVPLKTIQSGDQQQLTVFVRGLFYFIARTKTEHGWQSLAKVAGRKHHASCIQRLQKVEAFFKDHNAEFLTLWYHYLTHSKLFTLKDFQ